MDNNFKFKTRHVSIVQRSSSVVDSFTSSVELIPAIVSRFNLYAIAGINSTELVHEFTTEDDQLNDRNMSCFKLTVVVHFLKTHK